MNTETVDLNMDSVIVSDNNSCNEASIDNYIESIPGFAISMMPSDGLTYDIKLNEEMPGHFAADSIDIRTIVYEDGLDQHSLKTKIKNKAVLFSRRSTKNKSIADPEDTVEDKQSNEYRLRRERNNKFVRACREKTRQRNKEVEHRVTELLTENKQLSQKVDALTSELVVYKNLFSSVGVLVPAEVDRILNDPVDKPNISSDT